LSDTFKECGHEEHPRKSRNAPVWVFSFYHLLSVIGKLPLFLCRTESRLNSLAHIKIYNTLLGIVETSDLVAFFVIVILNELGNGIVDILVTTTERRGLFSLRLGESGSLCLVTLARTDSKHTLCCIHAILHILRIAQVLKDTLGEGNAVLVDVNVRGSVSGSVDNLKVDVRKIDSHNYSFLSTSGSSRPVIPLIILITSFRSSLVQLLSNRKNPRKAPFFTLANTNFFFILATAFFCLPERTCDNKVCTCAHLSRGIIAGWSFSQCHCVRTSRLATDL